MPTKSEVLAEITARSGRTMQQIGHRLVNDAEPSVGADYDYPINGDVKAHIRRLIAERAIYATTTGYEVL